MCALTGILLLLVAGARILLSLTQGAFPPPQLLFSEQFSSLDSKTPKTFKARPLKFSAKKTGGGKALAAVLIGFSSQIQVKLNAPATKLKAVTISLKGAMHIR